jgi:hypothetical protein
VINRSKKSLRFETKTDSQDFPLQRHLSERSLHSGFASSYNTLKGRGVNSSIINREGSPLVRSDAFWKQQTNLMVEIFKNKLSLKHPKRWIKGRLNFRNIYDFSMLHYYHHTFHNSGAFIFYQYWVKYLVRWWKTKLPQAWIKLILMLGG